MITFKQASEASPGHTNGFDYLRLGLSTAVLVVHCTQIAEFEYFKLLWKSDFGPLMSVILPAFFALSGYLVCGSLFRNSIPQFLTLRALRIFPALTVEIVLTALIVGPIFTTFPLETYFTSSGFFKYFLNSIGIIHYTLPGVFNGNPPNMQLWTVPFELECYILLVILAFFRLPWKPMLFLVVSALLFVAYSGNFFLTNTYSGGENVPGKVLVFCFLFGCLFYIFRDRVPHSWPLALLGLVVAYMCLRIPSLTPLSAPAVAYTTIYIGLLRLHPIPFGDLSYGIFLFHSPVGMSIDDLSGREISLPFLIVLTTVITAGFAALSWTFIEKPILDLKPKVLRGVGRSTDRSLAFLVRSMPIVIRLLPKRGADHELSSIQKLRSETAR